MKNFGFDTLFEDVVKVVADNNLVNANLVPTDATSNKNIGISVNRN